MRLRASPLLCLFGRGTLTETCGLVPRYSLSKIEELEASARSSEASARSSEARANDALDAAAKATKEAAELARERDRALLLLRERDEAAVGRHTHDRSIPGQQPLQMPGMAWGSGAPLDEAHGFAGLPPHLMHHHFARVPDVVSPAQLAPPFFNMPGAPGLPPVAWPGAPPPFPPHGHDAYSGLPPVAFGNFQQDMLPVQAHAAAALAPPGYVVNPASAAPPPLPLPLPVAAPTAAAESAPPMLNTAGLLDVLKRAAPADAASAVAPEALLERVLSFLRPHSWAQDYAPQLGSIAQFVAAHPDVFQLTPDGRLHRFVPVPPAVHMMVTPMAPPVCAPARPPAEEASAGAYDARQNGGRGRGAGGRRKAPGGRGGGRAAADPAANYF